MCILASFVLGTLCKCTLCKYFKTYALGTLHIFLDCFLGFWTKYVWGTQSVQPGNYVREGGISGRISSNVEQICYPPLVPSFQFMWNKTNQQQSS